jgi:hypothetical protein
VSCSGPALHYQDARLGDLGTELFTIKREPLELPEAQSPHMPDLTDDLFSLEREAPARTMSEAATAEKSRRRPLYCLPGAISHR